MPTTQELIQVQVQQLINQSKISLNEIKVVAVAQAWKVLQLAVASVIQIIETTGTDLASPDKKKLAMDLLSQFYDSVFLVVDVPFVPSVLNPIIKKYVKAFLMILVSSTIDAMVTTFRNTGVFNDPKASVNALKDIKPRISQK
jgi:predicted rRNA methylase YqxC with S4 and FtsJ domains